MTETLQDFTMGRLHATYIAARVPRQGKARSPKSCKYSCAVLKRHSGQIGLFICLFSRDSSSRIVYRRTTQLEKRSTLDELNPA